MDFFTTSHVLEISRGGGVVLPTVQFQSSIIRKCADEYIDALMGKQAADVDDGVLARCGSERKALRIHSAVHYGGPGGEPRMEGCSELTHSEMTIYQAVTGAG